MPPERDRLRPRVCVERRLPTHLPVVRGLNPLAIALKTSTHWEPGRMLTIGFRLDASGRAAPRKRVNEVLAAAAEWTRFANLQIIEVDHGDADLRCQFDNSLGSWSYVGSEALSLASDQPTMNMGWPDDPARDLHEMGHALGYVHEHQLPDAAIPWDINRVIAYYAGPPNYWSPAETRSQVLDRLDATTLTNFGYDAHSIMEYAIPAELLTDARRAIPWNRVLSAEDKSSAAHIYPRSPR